MSISLPAEQVTPGKVLLPLEGFRWITPPASSHYLRGEVENVPHPRGPLEGDAVHAGSEAVRTTHAGG